MRGWGGAAGLGDQPAPGSGACAAQTDLGSLSCTPHPSTFSCRICCCSRHSSRRRDLKAKVSAKWLGSSSVTSWLRAVFWGGGVGGYSSGLTLCWGSGFQALVLTALLVGLGVSAGLPLGMLTEMLLPLAWVATLTAFIFSLLLYLKALMAPASALAPGGNSGERGSSGDRWGRTGVLACSLTLRCSPGNPLYDFFLGRELNPRFGSFDCKYFCELRPGLIGWVCWAWLSGTCASRRGGAVSSSWAGQVQYCPDIIHSFHKYLLNLICVLGNTVVAGI